MLPGADDEFIDWVLSLKRLEVLGIDRVSPKGYDGILLKRVVLSPVYAQIKHLYVNHQQLTIFGQNALAKFIANSTLLVTLGLNKTVTQDVNWHPTILLHMAGRKNVYLEQQEQIANPRPILSGSSDHRWY